MLVFFAFAADSGQNADLVEHARHVGLGDNMDGVRGGADPHVVREREPPTIAVAKQSVVKDILRDAGAVLTRYAPKPHVAAFRNTFHAGPDREDVIQQYWHLFHGAMTQIGFQTPLKKNKTKTGEGDPPRGHGRHQCQVLDDYFLNDSTLDAGPFLLTTPGEQHDN